MKRERRAAENNAHDVVQCSKCHRGVSKAELQPTQVIG